MKIPSISSVTKSIRNCVVGAMIATPAAGVLQSCETLALNVGHEVPVYVHRAPAILPPPPRTYHYHPPVRHINRPPARPAYPPTPKRPPVINNRPPANPPARPQPGHQQPSVRPSQPNKPQGNRPHVNSHGDTFQRGSR